MKKGVIINRRWDSLFFSKVTALSKQKMLTYILQAKAELHNVAKVQPVDDEIYPHDYKFKFQCNGCKTVHPNPVQINRFETIQVTGFRRLANILIKCKACQRERYAIISKVGPGCIQVENDGVGGDEFCDILKIHTHGMRILEFIPDDQYECVTTYGKLIQGIGLLDGKWDESDEEGTELKISNVDWNLKLVSEKDPKYK
ncbi:hypothetical protein CORT_0C05490 [Candida orthopsilosis Co 90-125]|uniref:Uncharacterized protein n=1 Tax=Candida orthopsilosis (strain 90-125) TaxID=1136231 RepID=H8X363_CANO9|nr:hypothetical protein CORT_0C05490 [Candida orthopsilosis Co 90-125]CCG25923.1 hypothetical protein CORT_0C05490 [Candida orthopsilosis Co 90-125]